MPADFYINIIDFLFHKGKYSESKCRSHSHIQVKCIYAHAYTIGTRMVNEWGRSRAIETESHQHEVWKMVYIVHTWRRNDVYFKISTATIWLCFINTVYWLQWMCLFFNCSIQSNRNLSLKTKTKTKTLKNRVRSLLSRFWERLLCFWIYCSKISQTYTLIVGVVVVVVSH